MSAPSTIGVPIGLHVRDPQIRRRERAVRRLLERGVLRNERLIEALLTVAPEDYLGDEEAEAMLAGRLPPIAREGEPAAWVGIGTLAAGLEALEPNLGDRAGDLLATRGYVAALLSELVGPSGEVVAVHPGSMWSARRLRRVLSSLENTGVSRGAATTVDGLEGLFDRLWLGGVLPRAPRALVGHLLDPDGRLVTLLGPRFRPQDLVCLTLRDGALGERTVARVRGPVVAGPNGWLDRPREVS